MLTLSRKVGESIIIRNGNEVIEVRLSRMQGDKALISIGVTEKYEIIREELIKIIE